MTKLREALFLLCFGFAGASAQQRAAPRAELWAFAGPWDARSDSSLRANARRLDVAVTGWIELDSLKAEPVFPVNFPDTMRLVSGLERMALVTTWQTDRFHPSTVRMLARDDAKLARVAGAIAGHSAKMHYTGLVLDFEELERSDVPSLVRVVKAIADSAHKHGIASIVVAVPALGLAAYPGRALAAVADFIMPMLYDQHWSTSGPGPISEPGWVRSALAGRVAEVGAAKIIAAFPTYGYRWSPKSGKPAEPISFAAARRAASQAGVSLERDGASHTMRAVKRGEWEIWATDAGLLTSLAREAKEAGVQRVALWRIGLEDPDIWRALAR
ncbi:MAG TPA: hypothetical protein VIP11_03685 [Gemmatimonadaceae bacterium]